MSIDDKEKCVLEYKHMYISYTMYKPHTCTCTCTCTCTFII